MSPSDQAEARASQDPVADEPHLGDTQAVLMAAAAWAAAGLAPPVGPTVSSAIAPVVLCGLAAGAAGLALARRRPRLFVVAVAALAGARAMLVDAGYQPIVPAPLDAEISLVSDPSPFGAGWRADARLDDGQRVETWGYGAVGFDLGRRVAGDRLQVTGQLRTIPDEPWRRARHLVGRLHLTAIHGHQGPAGPRRVVEAVRAVVSRGADGLPEDVRPLYLGLVIGDDRLQPAAQQARFRAAGLAHLLAVSGQNVAFLLAVVRPLITLAGRRARFGLTLVVLCGFALATRAEPSVLRATATAAVAAWAATGGHRQAGLRLLALAVTGLLLVDPFLVHSVGFRLSVAASAGILVLSPRLLSRIRLHPVVAEPLAITMGAQIAVLPLLLATFGPVSLASLPANLLAGWAAGAVMTWGLTVGPVAGVLPGPLATVAQAPPAVLLWWIDGVAAWAARLPLPLIDGRLAVLALVTVGVAWLGGRSHHGCRWRPVAIVVAAATFGAALAAVPAPPDTITVLSGGGLWVPGDDDHPSLLVIGADADDRLLDDLLTHRISSVDVVVTVAGTGRAAALVRQITEVTPAGVILAPPLHRVRDARTVRQPLVVASIVPVTITPAPAAGRPGRLEISTGTGGR